MSVFFLLKKFCYSKHGMAPHPWCRSSFLKRLQGDLVIQWKGRRASSGVWTEWVGYRLLPLFNLNCVCRRFSLKKAVVDVPEQSWNLLL